MSTWDQPARPESVGFFEKAIGGHSKVEGLLPIGEQAYAVIRASLPTLRVWVCDVYRVSASDVAAILAEDPQIQAIVTMSNWNDVTVEAKEDGTARRVGVFTFKELMGALNYQGDEFFDYQTPRRSRSLG